MKTEITRKPEDKELKRKLSQLASLEEKLAQQEMELATLQTQINIFEREYLCIVGVKYAELDEIKARIAEHYAKRNPEDEEIQRRFYEAHQEAQESKRATEEALSVKSEAKAFAPSERLRKLYRESAKSFHPDLATDERQRLQRNHFMAQANQAYEKGDEERLEQILLEWQSSPEAITGEGVGDELVRTIRKISQVRKRIKEIQRELNAIRKSEIHQLKIRADAAKKAGRDLLNEMAARLDKNIDAAKQHLLQLTSP